MKVIKAQLYINKKVNEEQGKHICNKIDKEIEGWPIDYNSYQGNLDNKEIMVFNVYIRANTFKDCEYFYQIMKRAIKDCSYEAVHQVAKIKAEEIVGI